MICVTVVVLDRPETIHCPSAQQYSYCKANKRSEVQSLGVSTGSVKIHISPHMQCWNCHLKFVEVRQKFNELLLIFRI